MNIGEQKPSGRLKTTGLTLSSLSWFYNDNPRRLLVIIILIGLVISTYISKAVHPWFRSSHQITITDRTAVEHLSLSPNITLPVPTVRLTPVRASSRENTSVLQVPTTSKLPSLNVTSTSTRQTTPTNKVTFSSTVSIPTSSHTPSMNPSSSEITSSTSGDVQTSQTTTPTTPTTTTTTQLLNTTRISTSISTSTSTEVPSKSSTEQTSSDVTTFTAATTTTTAAATTTTSTTPPLPPPPPTTTTAATSSSTSSSTATTTAAATTTGVPCTAEFKSRHLMRPGITGRLGNQLFELCTVLAAADTYCYTAVVLPEEVAGLFAIFNVQNLVVMEYNLSDFQGSIGESGFANYDGPVLKGRTLDVNWTVSGYRQSYKYFQNQSELIRSSFIFKDEIQTDVWNYFVNNSLEAKTRVGIHVRRGDFVGRLGYHTSTVEYLTEAMAVFKFFRDVVFIVVSDDIQWCRENLQSPNIYFSPFADIGRDLCISTQCDHNIITAGTFSWFGAWLNETGIVIYDILYPEPGTYLANGFKNRDYYPERWIGL